MMYAITYYAFCLSVLLSPFFLGTLDVFPQCVFLAALWLLFFAFAASGRASSPSPALVFNATPCFYAFFIYGAFYFFSAAMAPEARWASRNAALQMTLYALFFLLPFFLRRIENILFLLKTAVFSGFCVALYGIGFYILYGQTDYFIFSTFLNPNECAGYLILVISLALGMYMYEDDPVKKYRFFLFIILMSVCLILTASRAAWASFFLAALYFTLRKKHLPSGARSLFTHKFVMLACALMFFSLLAIKAPVLEKFSHAFSMQDRSFLFRTLVWKGTLRMASERPLLGFGPGSFEWWYAHFKPGGVNTKMVHNTYLQHAAETGFPGFAAFLFFLFTLLSRMRKLCRGAEDKTQFLYLGTGSAFIAFLLHNTFDYTFYIPATGGLFFLLAGCFLAMESLDPSSAPRKKHALPPAFFPAFLLLTPLLFYFSALAGLSDYYVQKAWNKEFDKNFQDAYALYRRASRVDPKNAEVRMQTGVYARYYKDYARSEKALSRAVSLAPSHAAFRNELGFTLLKTGKKESAMKQFSISSALNPSGTIPKRALGQIYFNDALMAVQNRDKPRAFFCLENALHWYGKISALSRSVYESDAYEPLAGRERNKDFAEAEAMLKTIQNLQLQLKEEK